LFEREKRFAEGIGFGSKKLPVVGTILFQIQWNLLDFLFCLVEPGWLLD
jgi:hypothetical protein